MKTLLSLLLLGLTLAQSRAADSTLVKFETGSWANVLAKAKRLNRPIFVDVYTTWCGPCKKMEKEVFTDANVADRMNKAFVNYRVDAEKRAGIGFAKIYEVRSYPNLLVISAAGDLLYRTAGYGNISSFLAEMERGLEAAKDPRTLAVLER